MKRLLFVLILILGGCATWQTKTKKIAYTTNEATKAAVEIAKPILEIQRTNAINTCAKRKDRICPELQAIHKTFDIVVDSVIAVKCAITDALLAVEMGNQENTWERLGVALAILKTMRTQVCDIANKYHEKDDVKWKTFCKQLIQF